MKISIITPSFNQAEFLGFTLDSVLSQRGDFEVEHLVMDGGSTDGSVELLRRRAETDPRLVWRSAKDRGQSDAVCKGLAMATGDIVGWLNSDDVYAPGAFTKVIADFASHPDRGWLVGRCQNINAQGKEIRRWVTWYKNRLLSGYSYGGLVRENMVCQPSVFWRRSFGEAIGGPDLALHQTMDYDLWLRMGRRSEPIIVREVLSQFRIHGKSKGIRIAERFEEHSATAARHAPDYPWSVRMNRLHAKRTVLVYRLLSAIGLGG